MTSQYYIPIDFRDIRFIEHITGSVEHKLYIKSVFNLAKSIVIKSHELAIAINNDLTLKRQPVIDDPKTWKYYLNLAGEYHPTDKLMTIKSLDTLETIPFTKEIIKNHPYTKEQYKIGNIYYDELIETYPDQEALIKGIIYPVNIDEAIANPNNSILMYDKQFVEPHEYTLMEDLNHWIQLYRNRWFIPAFSIVDSLYLESSLHILYMAIPQKILLLRQQRTKTNEVHTFHITQYLESHGKLSKYIPYLTLKQKLWLYRNIRYILKHVGQKETHYWLIEHLLTERKIPVNDILMRQLDDKDLDDPYVLNISYDHNPVNTQYNAILRPLYDLTTLLEKERNLTGERAVIEEPKIKQLTLQSKSNRLQTKALESSAYNTIIRKYVDKLDFIINQWGYMAFSGSYTGYVYIENPRSKTDIVLPVKDAFIWMLWISFKLEDQDIAYIPKYLVDQCIPDETAPLSQLENQIPSNIIPLTEREEYISRLPVTKAVSGKSAFYELVNTNYNLYTSQLLEIGSKDDLYQRAFLETLFHFPYQRKILHDDSLVRFKDWATNTEIPEIEFSYEELLKISSQLFENATGYFVNNTTTQKGIQSAMIELFLTLSSYTIQFLDNFNQPDLKIMGYRSLRLGNERWNKEYFYRLGIINSNFIRRESKKVSFSIRGDNETIPSLSVKKQISLKTDKMTRFKDFQLNLRTAYHIPTGKSYTLKGQTNYSLGEGGILPEMPDMPIGV